MISIYNIKTNVPYEKINISSFNPFLFYIQCKLMKENMRKKRIKLNLAEQKK